MPKIILDIKLYSMDEAAELLGVTKGTLTKYISNGRLQAKIIGGKKYVSEDNLKCFLQNAK